MNDIAKYELVPFTRGRVLQLGQEKIFPHFITLGVNDLNLFAPVMDAVYVGELDEPESLKNVSKVLKNGGYVCSTKDLTEVLQKTGNTWDYLHRDNYHIYSKGGPQRESWKKPKPSRRAIVLRYGGFGDMLQACSVFPGLKEQGYHLTVATYERGKDLLKEDPHVDAFVIQDPDQVPSDEIGLYVEYLKTVYQKVVNLCESVEGSLVALPGRTARYWPKSARHFLMDKNYLEMTHAIADVPYPFRMKFYPSLEEREWALKERTRMGGKPIILWALSGSSVNKAWPYLDIVVARLLTSFDCRIIFVGGEADAYLEKGWENEPRVLKRCGVWNTRQSMTFAMRQADVVVGPDTGIMQAVGLEDVPKVLILGHSTIEQVSKHWKNTVSIEPPPSVECRGCLLLHYNFDDCHRGPQTGVALCQESIPPDIVWAGILGSLKKTKLEVV